MAIWFSSVVAQVVMRRKSTLIVLLEKPASNSGVHHFEGKGQNETLIVL